MRDLLRNQQTFYYALYDGKEDVTDTSGLKTGEKRISYSEPVAMKANISPNNGTTYVAAFGLDLQYSNTIVTCDMECPISETSILWIGIEPEGSKGNPIPHNYIVKRVAKGLNNILYAVDKVELR